MLFDSTLQSTCEWIYQFYSTRNFHSDFVGFLLAKKIFGKVFINNIFHRLIERKNNIFQKYYVKF